MSSAAQALIAMAIVPAALGCVIHEMRAAFSGLHAPAPTRQHVDVRVIEPQPLGARTPAHDPALPPAPDHWRIAA